MWSIGVPDESLLGPWWCSLNFIWIELSGSILRISSRDSDIFWLALILAGL